jgi:cytochrome P450
MSEADTLPYGMPYRKDTRYDPPTALLDLQSVPVRRIRYHPDGVEGWLVTGYAEARQALADVRWSNAVDPVRSPIDLPGFHDAGRPVTPGFFNFFDPPEHTRIRRKLTGSFTLRRMRALEAHVADLVDGHIDAMRAKGAPADLVTDFALPVPALLIGELLGVPDADRGKFHTASTEVVDMTLSFERRGQVMMELLATSAGSSPASASTPGPTSSPTWPPTPTSATTRSAAWPRSSSSPATRPPRTCSPSAPSHSWSTPTRWRGSARTPPSCPGPSKSCCASSPSSTSDD